MSALVETWLIHDRINRYLLEAIPDDDLGIKLAKGKDVLGQFSHIHNVRLMWLKASAPDLMEGLQKLEAPDRDTTAQQLELSGAAIGQLIERSEVTGKVKNFKPHTTAFLGYLISHESNHRGHAELALRQAGRPISDKTMYGLWEWGVR
jgi:uncharacterized damage-inducible protein DinB